jgi:hypothetical protein
MHDPVAPAPPSKYPFAQGVGTIFQFVGVTLFLISMFVCCSTSLLSKDTATHSNLTTIGWHRPGDPPDLPTYSAQRALTITLPAAICYGMALAALGLGLQTESRNAPLYALLLNLFAIVFWIAHLAFFASLKWIILSILCTTLVMLSALLVILSIGAWRELRQPASIA